MGDRGHAVVIGASMGGLLAARALCDHFASVTVLERDPLPDAPANRRGVPQGRHVHALLGRGKQLLDEWFPGMTADLVARGAPLVENFDHMHFSVLGHLMTQAPVPAPTFEPVLHASRPFLEDAVRTRLSALDNVEIRDSFTVSRPETTPDRGRVVGVHGRPDRSDDEELVMADLVVDASGRSARTPAWLEELGYDRPRAEEVKVRIRYASQLFRLGDLRPARLFYLVGPIAERAHGFGAFVYEDDTLLLTVAGIEEEACEAETGAMLAKIAGLAPEELVAAIRAAEALSEPVGFSYPVARWHHYEKLRSFPEGLLVTGDAVCSFNPIYGQGMTVSALEADALARAVADGDQRLARRFAKAAAKVANVSWQMSAGPDLALPQVPGEPSLQMKVANAWVDRVLRAAHTDAVVAEQFLRVGAFLDPPPALFRPAVVRRTVSARRRGE